MTISEKLHSANEGSAFLVGYKDHAAVAAEETYCSFDDPDKGQDGEDEGGPVDEGSLLVVKNGPKRPSNGDRRRKVAFRRSEGVSSSGTFKEEEGKENKDIGPDTRFMVEGIYTKGVEHADDD